MAITIEPMVLADIPFVAAIEADSFTEPWSAQSFRSELADNKPSAYLVARVDGAVVAYAGVWVILDEAHITTLAVDKNYRRCGIAAQLLETLLDKSYQMGARRILLEVRPSNDAARRLYEKLGFIVSFVRKRYYFDEDGLVMVKENINGRLGSYG